MADTTDVIKDASTGLVEDDPLAPSPAAGPTKKRKLGASTP